MTLLYTFTVSHFSEKARWALDFEGIEFEEVPLLPGPHVVRIKRIAPRTQVPVLVHDGEVLQGSGAIVDALPRLFGATRLQPWQSDPASSSVDVSNCQDWETMGDASIGRAIQAFGYDEFLRDPKLLKDFWSQGGPRWAPAFYAVAFPVLRMVVRRGYCGDAERIERFRSMFMRALDRSDAVLRSKPYLLGDFPTRADITWAALLAPLVQPDEHPLPQKKYPRNLALFIESIEDRPTLSWVRRMYRTHR